MVKKNKLKNGWIFIIIIVALLVTIIAFFIINNLKLTSKVTDEEKEKYLDWLGDNCNCIEREKLKCRNGEFKLDEERRLCVKGNETTSILLGCSMYNCSGEINKVE